MTARLAQLHVRWIHGDLSAGEELAALLLPLLETEFHVRFPSLDPDIIHDSAIDGILSYLSRPTRCAGHEYALHHLIAAEVRHQITNRVRSEVRRRRRERKWAESCQFHTAENQPGPDLPDDDERRARARRFCQTDEEWQCLLLLWHGQANRSGTPDPPGPEPVEPPLTPRRMKLIRQRLLTRLRRLNRTAARRIPRPPLISQRQKDNQPD
jgi:hypothetical protein